MLKFERNILKFNVFDGEFLIHFTCETGYYVKTLNIPPFPPPLCQTYFIKAALAKLFIRKILCLKVDKRPLICH